MLTFPQLHSIYRYLKTKQTITESRQLRLMLLFLTHLIMNESHLGSICRHAKVDMGKLWDPDSALHKRLEATKEHWEWLCT